MMKTVAYCRVSSREQSINSNALEQQIARVKSAGATDIYIDVESGYKGKKRKQLDALMELVRSRQVSEIIITRFDRLSRKSKQAFALIEEFIEASVVLRALDEPFDLTTSSGRMAAGQLAVFAQYHSDQKSESVKHGWKHLRKQQKAINPPFGYKVVDVNEGGQEARRYRADIQEFVCLLSTREEKSRWDVGKEIIEAFGEAKSLRGCLKIINERYGIETFAHHQQSGGLFARGLFRFSPGGLRNWLLNPVLRGHTCYLKNKGTPDIRYNTHPDKLLTDLQAKQIEEQLARNYQVRGYGCSSPIYPLSGLVFCGECRSTCYSVKAGRGKNQPGYNYYYQCKNWRMRGCQQKQMVRMEVIEKIIIAALTQKAIAITNIANTPPKAIAPPELQQLRDNLATLSAMPFNSAIEKAKNELRLQITQFEHDLGQQKLEGGDRLKLLQAFSDAIAWEATPDTEKRPIYRALVEKVVVKGGMVVDVVLKV